MARGEKKCPQCAEMVKREALVCRFCGHQFEPETTIATRPGMGTVIAVIAGVLLLLFVVGQFGSGSNASSNAPTQSTAAATGQESSSASSDAAPAAPGSKWSYFSEQDAVRGTARRFARISSDNEANFEFPYAGGSTLSILIRRDHRGDNVMFEIDKGQFVCGVETCAGAINVDGKHHALTLTSSAEGSSTVLFAENDRAAVRELLGAKKIVVELPFYQHGNEQFTFTTPVGLKWPPKS